ncbi:DNA-directed RNA polymerase, partial [Ostertagia ostertagi]
MLKCGNVLKSRVQARPVFDALNQLGSTPWRINEPMLDVLCQVFEMSSDVTKAELLDTLAVPLRSDTVEVPEYRCIDRRGRGSQAEEAEAIREERTQFPMVLDEVSHSIGTTFSRPDTLLSQLDFEWTGLSYITAKDGGLQSEEPWQTLAACMEIRDALAFPGRTEDFVSTYAALGRDEEGGREVNLLKSELPNDVYSSVAQRVEQKRLEDEKGGPNMEIALRLRKFMPQPVPRKVIKQTVMTTVYGVTLYGAALQIKRQLKALDIDNEETAKFAQYLTHKTFASLHDAFTCSMSKVGAFPPNLVHSLDSCHMMLTSLECSRRGVTFAAVHDCFWTHASTVDEMGKLCREQFIRLHSEPIVQQCSDWFHSHYLTGPHIELMPPQDLAHFRKLFTCQVEAGDLDINQVKDSVYFF